MSDCLFCRVVKGEVAAQTVFSNERIVAFKDINPQAPTHVLICPVKHIAALSEASAEDAGVLGEIQYVAAGVAKKGGLEGFRLVLNNGRSAGQSVDHIHYHLLGGRRLAWPPG